MNLTKKQEAECMQVYETWWNSYLNGDVKTYDSFLADDFHFVGSTNGEEYLDRKNTTAFFDATAHQLAGKAELRNLKRIIEELDEDLILITDLADAYVISEPQWVFYSRFRFTSLMKETKNGWRFVYQHFSAPDSKAQEGETLGTEQITKENQELRDAIKRRTIELENKSRELEIEAALERVRSRTMAMQKSEELAEASVLMFEQLKLLGISTYSSGFSIWENETLISWMCNADGSINPPFSMPVEGDAWHRLQYESWKNGEAFIWKDLQGEEMKSHFRYLRSFPLLDEAFKISIAAGHPMPERQVHHVANFSQGNLLFITLQPCPEAHTIFIRFAKVFDQTYTRFLDLQKAEAQAREAQIELGLERVRARAMAMQKSDELRELIGTVFTELTKLDLVLTRCLIMIFDLKTKGSTWWMANSEAPSDPIGLYIKYHMYPPYTAYINAWQERKNKWQYILEGTDKKEWDDFIFTETELSKLPDFVIEGMKKPDRVFLNASFNSFGNLTLASLQPLSEEHFDILLRFAKVFDLTYTRFNDLQKAEAQAREAQIEAALERVRSRTMAMQKSEELREVIQVIHNQLVLLGFEISNSGIMLDYKEKDDFDIWMADSYEEFPVKVHIPYIDHPQFNSYKDAKKKRLHFYSRTLTFEEKNKWFQHVFKNIKGITEATKEAVYSSPGMATSSVLLKNTAIYLLNYTGTPYTEAEIDTLMRFGKVFEQTYTRFNDLKQAEAQAREAKIEAALERTRTQSMIMQHSKELDDTLRVFHEQVLLLGIPSAFSFLWLPDEKNDRHIFWAAWGEKINGLTLFKSKAINYPLDRDEPATAQCLVDWKSNKPVYSYHVPPAAVENYFAVWQELIDGVDHLQPEYFSGGLHYVEAFMKYGCFGVMVTNDLTEDEKKLLIRFANEFERTYTRFLDLQKAEAQAREAQVEAALERVRSRTMAMQSSSELGAVAAELFAQMNQLVINLWTCGFVLCEKFRDEDEWWLSMDGNFTRGFFLPNTGDYAHATLYEGWLCGDALRAVQLDGEVLQQHYDWLMDIPVSRAIFEEMDAAGLARPDWQKLHAAYFSKGYLVLITREPCDEEEIFKRFAQVFDQTYTRFLDLQKAEAQARESQIELGLERVRARAMAMQHSNELSDLVDTVFKELTKLDFAISMCIINIIDESNLSNMVWAANPDTGKPPDSYYMRFEDYPFHHAMMKGYKERSGKFIYVIEGEEKKIYDEYLFNETEFSKMPLEAQAASKALEKYVSSFSFSNFGGLQTVGEKPLSDSNLDILARFGKVFDLTYTRFNDLKQAEAQAKEAKIEAALERVRSHSLAMQKSEELKDVIQVVYDQFIQLNIQIEHTGFIMDYKEREDMHIWLADQHAVPFQVTIPHFDCAHWNSFNDAKANGKNFFANHLSFEEKNKFYQDLFKLIPGVPKETLDYYLSCPGLAISTVLLDNVGLYIENFSGTPFTDDENNTLMRFGKVFQQTYTRFRDLQKAEAQAREAQIELSLERIRSQVTAMRESAELLDIVVTMRTEFVSLGHEAHYFWHMHWLPEKYDKAMTSGDGTRIGMVMKLPRHIHGDIQLVDEWEKSDEPTLVFAMDVKTAVDYVEKMITLGDFEQVDPNAPTLDDIRHIGGLTFIMARTTHGEIGYSLPGMVPEPPAEGIATLARFAGVFDLAYKRFEDLKIREEKNRETLIELAMERVRTKTMAMQHSDELPEAANVLFLEVQNLGIPAWSCGYNILSADKKSSFCIMSSEGELQIPFRLPLTEHESFLPWYEAIKNGDDFFVNQQGGEDLAEHYKYMTSLPELKPFFNQFEDAGISLPTFQINHLARFKQGFLLFITYQPVPEAHDIFKRFATLFEQTYTRFLDLQKAEAQAREAKIEAALEKVRSRSLAMHKAEELREVVAVVVEKLQELGVVLDANGVIICTYFPDSKNVLHWIASPDYSFVGSYLLPYFDHPIFNDAWNSKESGDEYFSKAFSVEEKNSFFEYAFEHSDYRYFPDDFKQWIFQNDQHILSFAWQKNSAILIPSHTGALPSADDIAILKRFANVFEQSYTRFLDLKKAEAQTREAQINLAVERVRARALAMFKSEEILQVVHKLKEEIMGLDIPHVIAATIHLKENDGRCRIWDISSIELNDEALHHPMDIRYKLEDTDPNFFMRRIWANTNSYFIEMQDESDLKRTIKWLRDNDRNQQADETELFIEKTKLKLLYHPTIQLSNGRMCIDLLDSPSPEIEFILEKMGAAFDLAYKRFEDLKNSEAQLRESQIEAALEKVRSRTLAMQKSDELAETSAVLFKQLINLGIEPNRLYITVMKDDSGEAEFWITDENGSKVSAAYRDNLNLNPTFKKMLDGWKVKAKSMVIDIQGVELQEYFNHLHSLDVSFKDGLKQKRRIQHLAYFNHGFIGMASPDEQPESTMHLLERFAAVFNLTYTRFNDLKIAEAHAIQAGEDLVKLQTEKKRAEEALNELQSAQKQLIQSEKMASLGELTAGIAHEIQNPLNFVNNFSEVSKELLDEMQAAIKSGDDAEVKDIMLDVIQNLEKINLHGKRADAIVKGMLQHSRSNNGQKEPTDINALADEYLRLAYHGLRAKDKAFNATLKTDFDENVGNINIIPQDIGRVVLNLITNAFYVVTEKKKENIAGYEPTVSVSTKKINDKVEIKVADNGNGIPHNILDKIFQPFFTTKPTGQGTGLGLSLAYDIVKAHGGELKVNTTEGEGSEFIIQLNI